MASTGTVLDFEKPIIELEARLAEMKALANPNNPQLLQTVGELEDKIQELKISIYGNLTGWQRVQLARHPNRPYTLDYIYAICSEFVELHGDRLGYDDKAIVGGMGKINGEPVIILGHQKGRDTKSRLYRNFGQANPEGYRKALRMMKLAEKFHKPVICLIDTPGAYPGAHAEENGVAEAIAHNLREMAILRTPIICFIIGEGASGGALGIGVADRIYMLENTWYTVISPESCSSILWHSWDHKQEAAEALHLTAKDNYELGIVDGIIEEPLGGAHRNPTLMYRNIKARILRDIRTLRNIPPDELVEQRIAKFGRMGVYQEG